MQENRPFQSIPDDDLLRRLAELMGQSRRVEADVVAHIAEVDDRRLYAREAFPSMFAYCMDVLHLSEAEAYLRILAGRASREHPMLLTMLADGRLHLTAIVKLAPHLTRENRDGLLERATHRSKRQVLALVAEIAPRPDVPARVRKVPGRRTPVTAGLLVRPINGDRPMLNVGPDPILELGPDAVAEPELGPDAVATRERGPDAAAAPGQEAWRDGAIVSDDSWPKHAPVIGPKASAVPAALNASVSPVSAVVGSPVSPAVVEPMSPGRYKVQFTASAEFHDKLERLRALMGFRGPGRDLAAVLEQAVTEKLERLEARRFARTRAPRKGRAERDTDAHPSPSSRHIPAAVRRAVRERDCDRCCYVDDQGRRCPEEKWLEFHHRHPIGFGGQHTVANVGLMCRAHNGYMAECDYGREAMARHRHQRRPSPAAAEQT